MNNYIYIAVMAAVSYTIRVLPLTLIRKPIKNQFIQSFLYYVPYVTLAVMTFPAIIHATQTPISGLVALIAGIIAAWLGAGVDPVSVICCVLVYLMIEVVQAKTFAEIHNSFYKNLYCNVFRKLLHLKKHYFQMKNSMEIVQMLQCDVSQVASMTDRYVVMSFSYVFRVISGLAGLMLLSPELFMLQDR